ncbi:MAG: PKD domain-containing protein, partial [Bacteroidetes bacterium]|nr:PKD domain-containing protein [Bacteroidota bacterium]
MRDAEKLTGVNLKFNILTLALLLSCSVINSQTIHADYTYTQACETFIFKDKSTSSGGGIYSYFWDFGDGDTSILINPVHTYAVPDEYLVTLTVTHEDTTITDSYSVTVEYFYPEAGFTSTNACSNFQFLDISLPPGELDSAYWHFGAGDTLRLYSQPFNADYTFSSEGEYIVFLIAFAKGCADTVSDTISFYIPEAGFSYSNTCNDFQFENQSSVSVGNLSYQWHFGDGNSSVEEDPAHTYLSQGEYEVALIAYHETGCSDTLIQTVSFYYPGPDYSFDGNCSNFEFTDESTPLGGANVSWQWDFGDGTGFSNLQNPQYTYLSPGNYPVKLIATHESGCVDSITKMVSFDFPEALFSYTNDCESFQFINNSTPLNEIDSVHWYFGEGDTLRLYVAPFNASYSYSEEGEYYVFLKVFNESGCWDSFLDTVSFYNPQAAFSFTNVCETFQFSNESTVAAGEMTYFWDFDDGNTSDEENPLHSFAASGDYEVSLTVTHESGCESATSQIASFYEPIAAFSHDAPCFGSQTCFYDESIPNATSITNWYWDFGTGITSGVANPCYIYTTPGTYIVTLSVKNSIGCMSEPSSDTLNVDWAPDADFSADIACFHDTSSFINETDTLGIPVTYWLWDFGDPGSGANNNSALFEPTHVFTAEGPFDITLTVENINGCSSSILKSIVVDSIPDAAFIAPDTIAVGAEITIIDNSIEHGNPILSRFWDFGDGITAFNPNPVIHTYESPGEYMICLTVTDIEGCTDSVCSAIIVTDVPHADFVYTTGSNLITNFFDNSFTESAIINWYWDFGDPLSVSDTATGIPDPSYTYPYAGYFPVYLKIFDIHSGIHDTTKIIYVGTAVVADFLSEDGCLGDT